MIETVASLIEELKNQELIILDKFALKHAPTIGEMYEGLTSDILKKAIPPHLGLQFVSGVIYDNSEKMTKQIDCMLVKGEGIEIPHTGKYKWHIKDVLVVFEVKKTLYSKDLEDAFKNSSSVHECFGRYFNSGECEFELDSSLLKRNFSEITRIVPPDYSKLNQLDYSLEMIYHILLMEQVSPIRIVLGYHGFKSEYNFRKSMIEFLGDNLLSKGFGVGSFPQLIISDKFSLLKINGCPYTIPMQDDYWDFYVSTSTKPIKLILEFIWTKLAKDYSLGGLWGEDLKIEQLNKFISGKSIKKGKFYGWDYKIAEISKAKLEEIIDEKEWSPTFLDEPQFVIINKLCYESKVNINDPDIVKYIESKGWQEKEFVQSLLDTSLVALDKNCLVLITDACQCAILSDGKFVAGENNSGRFTRWMDKNIIENNNE